MIRMMVNTTRMSPATPIRMYNIRWRTWHPVSSELSPQSFFPLQTFILSMHFPCRHSNFPAHVMLTCVLFWHPVSSEWSGQSFLPLQTRSLSIQRPSLHSNCPGHVPFFTVQLLSSDWSWQFTWPSQTRFLSKHSPESHVNSPRQNVLLNNPEIWWSVRSEHAPNLCTETELISFLLKDED